MNSSSKEKRNEYVKAWRNTPEGKLSVAKYREKSKQKRKDWAQQYYKDNKDEINRRVMDYRRSHPEKIQEWNEKNRKNDVWKNKSKKERKELADSYIIALIREEGSDKSIPEKKKEVLSYRIKKIIKKIDHEK